MACRNFLTIFSIKAFFPNKVCYKIPLSKHLITNFPKILHLIIINRDEYHPILGQQTPCHEQS